MQPEPHSRALRIFRAARASLVASLVLSIAGYTVATTSDDATAPYDESIINEIGWNSFLIFGAASLVLVAVALVAYARRENHQTSHSRRQR